jgi:hypothetical protein
MMGLVGLNHYGINVQYDRLQMLKIKSLSLFSIKEYA